MQAPRARLLRRVLDVDAIEEIVERALLDGDDRLARRLAPKPVGDEGAEPVEAPAQVDGIERNEDLDAERDREA